jgi:hypothetical protein
VNFSKPCRTGIEPPQLKRKAIVHGHCHQKAIMGMAHEKSIFSKLGLDFQLLDSGCCGMAGSFGFEAGHYEVSMNIGELVLLPAVRRAPKENLNYRRRLQLSRADPSGH